MGYSTIGQEHSLRLKGPNIISLQAAEIKAVLITGLKVS